MRNQYIDYWTQLINESEEEYLGERTNPNGTIDITESNDKTPDYSKLNNNYDNPLTAKHLIGILEEHLDAPVYYLGKNNVTVELNFFELQLFTTPNKLRARDFIKRIEIEMNRGVNGDNVIIGYVDRGDAMELLTRDQEVPNYKEIILFNIS